MSVQDEAEAIRTGARRVQHGDDVVLEVVGDRSIVLLGESSHGTHEFYRARAQITKRLILEKGFSAVAIEGDWPDASRVDRFIRAASDDDDADEALAGFRRFPTWMWRNADVLDLVGWLRAHDDALPAHAPRVRFFGLDLYGLFGAIERVLRYLGAVDPEAAAHAKSRYACFDHFAQDSQAYGYAASLGLSEGCEREAVAQLVELQREAAALRARDPDAFFDAESNARLIKNAERYYRTMMGRRNESWNLRDRHMVETLESVLAHLERQGAPPKVIVWAHNSHLGDARATEMSTRDELNVGQLVRERWGDASLLVGFSTYAGTVTAADDWDEPPRRHVVRPGLEGSWEEVFHQVGIERFALDMRALGAADDALRASRLQRAIGVVYRPQTERWSHYLDARPAEQFDLLLHFDRTRAVEPLDRSTFHTAEPAETYPRGL